MMESGTHTLSESGSLTAATDIDSFTITADSATIHAKLYYYPSSLLIDGVQHIHINGISFTGNGRIQIRNAQDFLIEDCNFFGTQLDLLYGVTIATILRVQFSDYCDQQPSSRHTTAKLMSSSSRLTVEYCTFANSDGIIIRGTNSASSMIHSNFVNNRKSHGGAIEVDSYCSYRRSLLISHSNFTGNTAENGGGAVYVSGNCMDSVIVNQSSFVNNLVLRGGGGAVYFDGNHASSQFRRTRDLYITITQSNFIQNTALSCGALCIDNGYHTDVRIMTSVFYCLLYTSPSPRDATLSRMPSSA